MCIRDSGYRDRVNLATKCPTWLIEKHGDFDRYLDTQLSKLQTDHIDMYLLHSLGKERWGVLVEADVFRFLDRAKQDGRILNAGFSFHDDVDVYKRQHKMCIAYLDWRCSGHGAVS